MPQKTILSTPENFLVNSDASLCHTKGFSSINQMVSEELFFELSTVVLSGNVLAHIQLIFKLTSDMMVPLSQ